MIFHDVSLQCSNGKGRAQWGVEILQCFIHWGWNGVKHLTQTHVNFYSFEGCQLASNMSLQGYGKRSGVPMPPWLVSQFSRMRGGFIIVRTSTWMAQGHLSPPRAFIYFSPQSIFHCPGLSSMFPRNSEDVLRKWIEIAMENGETRVDQCSKTSMFNVFPRVLGK
jgi:hypothetical protein